MQGEAAQHHPSLHWPCLATALIIMLGGTVYPLALLRADGSADHTLALALFWAMSAGMVRGVGFIPRIRLWKLFFSGWSCLAALLLGAVLRWGA
jgi:predicted membrane protein